MPGIYVMQMGSQYYFYDQIPLFRTVPLFNEIVFHHLLCKYIAHRMIM